MDLYNKMNAPAEPAPVKPVALTDIIDDEIPF
jgi:hypothetical protein